MGTWQPADYQMTLASDLLLVSGPTWIDEFGDTLESLGVTANVEYALDHGEQLRFISIARNTCVTVAIRPWGTFVALNREFYRANFEGSDHDLFSIAARNAAQSDWENFLIEALTLVEYDRWEFARIGLAAATELLSADGWRELAEPDERAIKDEHRFTFHPAIVVEEVFPVASARNQLCELDLEPVRALFEHDRKAFWTLEDEARRIIGDSMDEHGSQCRRLVVFNVNHETYALERPAGGWASAAHIAWPLQLLNCSGHELVFAPDIQEGLALNECFRRMVACGKIVSDRFSAWGRDRGIRTL